jgi:hypothetical protein
MMKWKGHLRYRSWHLLGVTDEDDKRLSQGRQSWGLNLVPDPPHPPRIRLRITKYLTATTGYRNTHGFLQLSDPANIYICVARSVAQSLFDIAVNETKKTKLFSFVAV